MKTRGALVALVSGAADDRARALIERNPTRCAVCQQCVAPVVANSPQRFLPCLETSDDGAGSSEPVSGFGGTLVSQGNEPSASTRFGVISLDCESDEDAEPTRPEGLQGAGITPSRVARTLTLHPGDLIADKYRVERVLGRGGMGQVVAAQHLALGSWFAIKLLQRRNSQAATRLIREARACAQLDNEYVRRVFDLGKLSDRMPYVVMEYLAGEDLAQLLARRRLAFSEAVEYVLHACMGLADAHALGIVHRDIKPANLFLTKRRNGKPLVKVLDFGISKIATEDDVVAGGAITSHGTVLGSPAYMSPEQIRASADVDARTDIWSLGVVLYELITGCLPFRGRTRTALAVAIATDRPPTPRTICPSLPRRLDAAVMRCLEKDPGARFPTIDALRDAIAPFARRRSSTSLDIEFAVKGSARNAVRPKRIGEERKEAGLSRAAERDLESRWIGPMGEGCAQSRWRAPEGIDTTPSKDETRDLAPWTPMPASWWKKWLHGAAGVLDLFIPSRHGGAA